MAMTKVVELLKRSIGLDAESIGSGHIERAVQRRQSAHGLADARAYWDYVCANGTELQALIEAVVVPETWFFRDREAFTALADICHQRWLRATTGVVRLLSLPSSTGEEAYSMAMALLDAGIPPDRFRIDAFDVSHRAIARAERAVYRKNSFRGHELSYRDRHFDRIADGWQLRDDVRRQVHFRQANLLDTGSAPGAELYDAVFCRNLLIYFDRPTQDRAVSILRNLLTAEGTLFVAPSETGLLLSHDFVSAKMALAFALQKSGGAVPTRQARPGRSARATTRPRSAVTPRPATPAAAVVQPATPAPPSPESSARPSDLERAIQLANQGALAEAASCCEEHTRLNGPSAQAFYLMAVVRDAGGNQSGAADYYRKALYLDPDHHDTLVHFALLNDQQGHASRAQALRNHAHRVEAARAR